MKTFPEIFCTKCKTVINNETPVAEKILVFNVETKSVLKLSTVKKAACPNRVITEGFMCPVLLAMSPRILL